MSGRKVFSFNSLSRFLLVAVVVVGLATMFLMSENEILEKKNTGLDKSPGSSHDIDFVMGEVGGGEVFIGKQLDSGEDTFCEPPDSATVVDENISGQEFEELVETAGYGDIIYIGEDAVVNADFTSDVEEYISIPSGVTLASNRGCNGSSGGKIMVSPGEQLEWDDSSELFKFDGSSNVTVTGLQILGPGNYSSEMPARRTAEGVGIQAVNSDNFELYNNFISNFPAECINVREGSKNAHVHHNNITFCNRLGTGYGVGVSSTSPPLVEFNYFNHYRHAIAANTNSYIFRYNYVGSERQNHQIDMHRRGKELDVYCNTLKGEEAYMVSQTHLDWEDNPSKLSVISSNWFERTSSAITIHNDSVGDDKEWEFSSNSVNIPNVQVDDNHFGEDEPGCGIGAPRESCTGSYSCYPS